MSIIDNVKEVAGLIKKIGDRNLYTKILELETEIFELTHENRELKESIRSLQEEAEIKKNLIWDPPYYWLPIGDKKDGPYCQVCYDDQKKLIRLQQHKHNVGRWKCEKCDTFFKDKHYTPLNPSGATNSSWIRR